jgi:hypothetical protein
MKSRSSTGVGQKIDLEYNIDTMRISGLPDEESGNNGQPYGKGGSSIVNQLKARSTLDAGSSAPVSTKWEKPQPKEGFSLEAPRIQAEVESVKIKNLLNNIKNKSDL